MIAYFNVHEQYSYFMTNCSKALTLSIMMVKCCQDKTKYFKHILNLKMGPLCVG